MPEQHGCLYSQPLQSRGSHFQSETVRLFPRPYLLADGTSPLSPSRIRMLAHIGKALVTAAVYLSYRRCAGQDLTTWLCSLHFWPSGDTFDQFPNGQPCKRLERPWRYQHFVTQAACRCGRPFCCCSYSTVEIRELAEPSTGARTGHEVHTTATGAQCQVWRCVLGAGHRARARTLLALIERKTEALIASAL